MASQIELCIAKLAQGEVAFIDRGVGPAIIFLHGIGSAARSWEPQLEELSARWRVVAWNAPGYPPSTPLPVEWPTASHYAQRLASLLDHLNLNTCHLVGHSLGCLIAARFALLNPERIATLTLASCALGHAQLAETERERLLASRIADIEAMGPRAMAEKRGPRLLGRNAGAHALRAVVDTMASVDPRGYVQASRMLSGGDLIADIRQLPDSLPLQFIYGSADVITPPEANQRAAATRPDAQVTVLEGAGHACYLEQSAMFSRAVEEHASKHG